MAASPPCCFRLEASRGPHSGSVHRYCSKDHAVSSSSSSPTSQLSIGRKKRCWLRLPKDLEVSSVHAEFRFIGDGTSVALRDAKSTNGTKLNGSPLKPLQDYPLSDGDLVAVGRTSLRFVKVVHGEQCGEEGDVDAASAASGYVLTPSGSSSAAAAPVVIVLDEAESAEEREGSEASASASASAARSGDTPADQPDTEPSHDDLALKSLVVSIGTKTSKKDGSDAVESKKDKEGKCRTGGVVGLTPEEATCTVCCATIGQLDLLEQQAHLNECLGGRVATKTVDTVAVDGVKPKTRKRANAGGGATRAKKPRKPKAVQGDNDDATTLPKPKKARKRKRVDAGENIELALALTDKSKMDKAQQTDLQLEVTKKKLEQLDVQMAKLVKRRANLVKTLDRLERTKEKLRKSQVLPPGKVKKFLDLTAALDAIFPSNREAHIVHRYASEKEAEQASVVAKRYAPTRWGANTIVTDCDEAKQAELAAVAAISMWARASQQLFGLQRDTLLYRNTVLRTFLGDDDDVNDDSFDMSNDNDDEDAELEREIDSDARAESAPAPPNADVVADSNSRWTPVVDADVPAVVERVFPNWQRDMAFLQDQTAEELEMALEAMNEAVAQVQDVAADDADPNRVKDVDTEGREESVTNDPLVSCSKDQPVTGDEQRRACEYMAQVMTQLIAEKRHCAVTSTSQPDHDHQQQRSVVHLVDSSGESNQEQAQVMSDIISASEREPSISTPEEVECSVAVKSTAPTADGTAIKPPSAGSSPLELNPC